MSKFKYKHMSCQMEVAVFIILQISLQCVEQNVKHAGSS